MTATDRRARSARTSARAASAGGPRPCPRRSTTTSRSCGATTHGDRAVGRRVAERVREQVEEHALDLLRRAADAQAVAVHHAGLEPDLPRAPAAASAAQARRDEAARAAHRELEGERAGVDARELEEVVDEPAEGAHLLAQRRQVVAPERRGRPRSPRASPAARRAACAGRGSPRRRARAARRRAPRARPPSR